MSFFRKRPIIIEAFQMTLARRNNNREWPEWLNKAWNQSVPEIGTLYIDAHDPDRMKLCIWTLEGCMQVSWNDWIIRGIKGELYPCKPEIFELTYEPL